MFLHGILKFALSIAESSKNIHYENICGLFKSDSFPFKKIYAQTWNCLSLHFSIVNVFANFNTWAQDFSFHPLIIEVYFYFMTSLRNIANVVLGSMNWFSSEKVAFVMRMCLKMMFLFPKYCGSCKEILAKETIQKTAIFHYPIIFRWFGLLFLRQYDHLDIKKQSALLQI